MCEELHTNRTQMLIRPNVRFGSKADILQCRSDVRFTPKSGHSELPSKCPLSARTRHSACLGGQGHLRSELRASFDPPKCSG